MANNTVQALTGLHAVVTGGGSGIGAAVAQALVAAGARVSLLGRNIDKLEGQAAAFARLGPVDILVNNAGQVESAPLAKTSLLLWQTMLNVNLTGTFLCSREVVAAYCAAKHGVLGLTRALDNIAHKTGRSLSEARAELVAANPQGRLVQPQEVADTIVWLAQRGSAALTGQAIAVCGGELM